ncbi:MAG TPA: serine/threonine-protein kinase [Polyangiaceae bacterium]|nr:serine/threonine-protein kinase [Polyangiaceae bacterium]
MALAIDVENRTTESTTAAVWAWVVAVAIELRVFAATIWGRAAGRRAIGPRPVSPTAEEPFGPYILGEKIGEGAMGIVYKAQDKVFERPTAIKLLPFDRAEGGTVERFEREFHLTSLLRHPNTISVYDFGRTPEGSLYYAMEYLEGLDLQALVDRTGPQAPARVAHLLAQICGALVEAHSAGLLHRDIKPANIFLCDGGEMQDTVKVLDFGLIKEFGQNARDAAETDVNAIVGTPTYLAPEAVTAPETMDGRSDLYAVGALGYFLLTGVPPFSGKTVLEVCCQHLHSVPVPPSARARASIPAELERLILSCLAKSPDARPRDAAALQSALLPIAKAWAHEETAVVSGSDVGMAVLRQAA